jgi:hypothetical protein
MRSAALLVLVGLLASSAAADGLRIKDGRYEGKVTVLTLTHDQIDALAKSRDLRLSPEQRRILEHAVGVSPSSLFIYFTKDGENDCTCGAANLGLRFSEREIEVPHEYLMSDEEAARREIE